MGKEKEQNSVSDRAQYLLKVLVERYIQEGLPVGSKTLAEQGSFHLGAASIRNIMAELEEKGYIRSVHTSSGRIPTAQGYRFFVDSLLQMRPIDATEIARLQLEVDQPLSPSALIQTVSHLLSDITHLVSIVTLPKQEHFVFRHVEFLPLSESRVLVILVVNELEVQNRIMHCAQDYSLDDLQQAANYLNSEFTGQMLSTIRQTLIMGMQKDKAELDRLTQLTIELAENTFEIPLAEKDYVMDGESNLLEMMDHTSTQKIRALLNAFTRKQEMLFIFDKCLRADGIQIFIGSESGHHLFDECAFITAPYKTGAISVGILGVIGSTRMAYERVISLVDVTARLLSAALTRV